MHYRAEVEGCGLTTTYPNPPNPFGVFIPFSVSAIQFASTFDSHIKVVKRFRAVFFDFV